MKGSCRDNQIHFTIKRDSKKSTACIAPFSWGDITLDEFESTHNKQLDYAKLLRSVAFNCLRFASEYELKEEDKELHPDLFTFQRKMQQIRKMNIEQKYGMYDDVFDKLSCVRAIERILKQNFDVDIDFTSCYDSCSEICTSTDSNRPDWIECSVTNGSIGEEYVVYIEMYLPEESAEWGVAKGMIVADKDNKRFLFEEEFLYQNRRLK